MPEDWSVEEVAAIVADYFAMLGHELRGEPFSKREHNQRLQAVLRNRSAGSIEFKHANISAILIELGFPYIDGYKPRRNYQELLRAEILNGLEGDAGLKSAAKRIVEAPVPTTPEILSADDVFVDPPSRERPRGVYQRRVAEPPVGERINYLEREARNSSLGAAGERFVLEVEHRRLWDAGHRRLAGKIEHVSKTRGGGLGYDIISFDGDGHERLIEVKTTTFGSMTPFFASSREVNVSESSSACFHLYRVFKFRKSPKLFSLRGSLRQTCDLDAVEYRASLL
jgi:hypothetical protein